MNVNGGWNVQLVRRRGDQSQGGISALLTLPPSKICVPQIKGPSEGLSWRAVLPVRLRLDMPKSL